MKTNSYPNIEEQNEYLNELRTGNDVKKVYGILEPDRHFTQQGTRVEYSDSSYIVLAIVSKMSTGFVVDICNRFMDTSNRYEMSDKQRWCVAFAFVKIQNEIDLRALGLVIE